MRNCERTEMMLKKAVLACAAALCVTGAQGEMLEFESTGPSGNETSLTAWMTAAGITTPQYLVTFESGFTNGQNISGITGLFPGGLVITDTSAAASAVVRSGAGVINGSNPIGTYALTQNELPYLELNFGASGVDYVSFYDIDHTGTSVIATFVGGATRSVDIEETGTGGNIEEFFGLVRNDRPRITRLQLDSSGDGMWGIDNLAYGTISAPIPEPETYALLLAGLGLMGWMARRRGPSLEAGFA